MNRTDAGVKFAEAIGEAIGFIILPIFFVVVGYAVARAVNKNRNLDDKVKWPIVVGATLALLVIVGLFIPNPNQLGPMDGVSISTANGGPSAKLPEPNDIGREALSAAKAYQKKKLVRFLDIEGWSYPDPAKFESSIVPVVYGENTVLKSRFRSLGYFDVLIHEGVVNGRITTVACTAKGRANIRFESSRCAGAVYDAFARGETSSEKL